MEARSGRPKPVRNDLSHHSPLLPRQGLPMRYEGASLVAPPGGGSVPGTPPSITCSVHCDPDQYLFSCRREGSTSHPAAIPVNVAFSAHRSVVSDPARVGELDAVRLLVVGGVPRRARRRCDESIRSANKPKKVARAIHEP